MICNSFLLSALLNWTLYKDGGAQQIHRLSYIILSKCFLHVVCWSRCFLQRNARKVAQFYQSVQQVSGSDNYLLAVVKSEFIAVQDSSAQDVFIAKDSDRHSNNGGKSGDFKNPQIDRRKNNAAVSHFYCGATIWPPGRSLPGLGYYQATGVAGIKKGEGFYALALCLHANREVGILGADYFVRLSHFSRAG